MNEICNFQHITWTDPFNRWAWESVCGKGGFWLMLVGVIIFVLYVIAKLSK